MPDEREMAQESERKARALKLLDAMIWRDVAAVHAFYDVTFDEIRAYFDQCRLQPDSYMQVFCSRAMLGPSNYSLVDGFIDPGGFPPVSDAAEVSDAR